MVCTSGYPVPDEDMCLLEISRLRETYGSRVKHIGFSCHHAGIALDVSAYTLGATVFERHFTLNRTWKGTDHAASLEPDGLRRTRRSVMSTWQALTYNQYSDYKQEMPASSSSCNWNEVLMYKKRNLMAYYGTRYLDSIPYSFDIKRYISWIDAVCDQQNPMLCDELEVISRRYVQYMIINKGESLMEESPIVQSYLMEAYFSVGIFDEFEKNFQKK